MEKAGKWQKMEMVENVMVENVMVENGKWKKLEDGRKW